ncbi:hypothetical protein LGV61_03575 [Desulfurispirillum indicum]|uniref:Uncharacterized protein n=1 Tax=Desulfurispirillum indicum (strain ATCC BAA-1389 / DSM 22839 / S5) TaxID=653733 RepID=E6W1R8_DESIS|nr:hypothetical protein [Desulfurispirillum indicum]ADU65450.1 hypothetical protein Selin_0706 [Desulfurispirillum indicum S5]UCZ57370.1 hypothetical protein LGV61_03575 [Desulfurispirillum indicum]
MRKKIVIPMVVTVALVALAFLAPMKRSEPVGQYVVVFADSRTWNVVVKDDGELFRLYKTELIGSTYLDLVSSPHNHMEIAQIVGAHANKPITQLVRSSESRG